MTLLRGNLHTHTVLSDGVNTPKEMIDAYAGLGYDFLALTDHRFDPVPHYYPASPAIAVLGGVEVTRSEYHYTMIVGDFEVLTYMGHPQRTFKTIAEVVRHGFAIIEATDHGVPISLAEGYVKDLGVMCVVSDDAHSLGDVGKAWIEVNIDGIFGVTLKDRIIKAIKMGHYNMVIV